MGSQDRKGPIDNPLRYGDTMIPGPRSEPIVHNTDQWMRQQPRIDTLAIMHVLEQIKTELRTLASEVAGLEAEIINIRRQMAPAQPWRR